MSRLLTLLGYETSHLRRNRARQWQRAAAVVAQQRRAQQRRALTIGDILNINLAAGYMAVGW